MWNCFKRLLAEKRVYSPLQEGVCRGAVSVIVAPKGDGNNSLYGLCINLFFKLVSVIVAPKGDGNYAFFYGFNS